MTEKEIEIVPIAQIHIANPRPRNRARWQMIVANIREVGLKKPVTLVRRSGVSADGKLFDLVCGQGRIEAFIELGETNVPAIIIDAGGESSERDHRRAFKKCPGSVALSGSVDRHGFSPLVRRQRFSGENRRPDLAGKSGFIGPHKLHIINNLDWLAESEGFEPSIEF